jgi:hypothetical protein
MYWRLVDLRAFLVSDPYEISGFSEGWLFGADALSDELRVLSCFLPGHTLMSRHVTGSVFPDKIEEKSLHLRKTPICSLRSPQRLDRNFCSHLVFLEANRVSVLRQAHDPGFGEVRQGRTELRYSAAFRHHEMD